MEEERKENILNSILSVKQTFELPESFVFF